MILIGGAWIVLLLFATLDGKMSERERSYGKQNKGNFEEIAKYSTCAVPMPELVWATGQGGGGGKGENVCQQEDPKGWGKLPVEA